jgi:hypothetical protein
MSIPFTGSLYPRMSRPMPEVGFLQLISRRLSVTPAARRKTGSRLPWKLQKSTPHVCEQHAAFSGDFFRCLHPAAPKILANF